MVPGTAHISVIERQRAEQSRPENEVAYHKKVNGALQSTLIPSAQNPELKSLLQTGLQIFQGHEQHAEQLAGSLK